MTRLPANPDVIVVGAGTSGLSAAKALRGAGLEVLVLEAASHVGGRCVTDTSTFKIPFDRGGSWLHSAQINPLARLAEKNEFGLHKTPWESHWVNTNGQSLNRTQIADYNHYQKSMWQAIDNVGSEDDDKSAAWAIPDSPWKDTAKHLVPQMLGGDADVASAADVWNYSDADGDWLVTGGLGSFVKTLHTDVAVQLNCPVSKIDYSGRGVRVETAKGNVNAKCLVLTVSTGVLAAEAIKFSPLLPNSKTTAISQLPNGILNKVGIEFDPEWCEALEGQTAEYLKGDDEFCTILFGFYNTNFAVGFVAGRFADLLEQEGEGAATAFCLEGLKTIFGGNVTKYVGLTSETSWRGNSLTQGSYSYALPGSAGARKTLSDPIDKRVYFAGEATMPNAQATVHGAYLSGKKVAQMIISDHL